MIWKDERLLRCYEKRASRRLPVGSLLPFEVFPVCDTLESASKMNSIDSPSYVLILNLRLLIGVSALRRPSSVDR
jgi:hypothetical protein